MKFKVIMYVVFVVSIVMAIVSIILNNIVLCVSAITLYLGLLFVVWFLDYRKCPDCGKIHGLKYIGKKLDDVKEELSVENVASHEVASIMTSKGPDFVLVNTNSPVVVKDVTEQGHKVYKCKCCGKVVKESFVSKYTKR